MSRWRQRLSARPEAVIAWVGTTATVVAVYAVVVLGGGLLVGATDSPDLALSVLATAVVAGTIEPVRARLQQAAARALHRGPAPYDVLAQFSADVSSAQRLEDLPARMARVLAEGTAAASAEVWLLVNGRPTLVASHPEGTGAARPADPPSLRDNAATGAGRRTATVAHAGRQLGALRVQERPNRPLSPVEERLFAGLAAQAGLVLHTAQLRAELATRREELAARASELRQARDRLVDAQDAERRRLERDIHDGAQQQLVALAINLRLAQRLGGSPDRAADLLGEQAVAAADAIATLTRLSRGAHPEVLTRDGLVPALRDAVARSPVPATFTSDTDGRFPVAIEAALYFCGIEALQNVAKHAAATRVEVNLTVADGSLRLTVADDGRGMDPDAAAGAGLANLRDRLAALDGDLVVDSAPGRGTTVTARVPAARVARQRRG